MKINDFFLKNKKITVVVLLVFIGISILARWQYNQSEQQKLKLERERVGEALRRAGAASAKIQQALKQKATSGEDDIIVPYELTDEGELVQVKLWHSLPKDKRAIMEIGATNVEVTATPLGE